MLTLTASGSVNDYSDTSGLRQKVAEAASVDVWFVSIRVAAASVLITATIAVPAASTASAVQSSLLFTLGGSAASATAALGVTVESLPMVAITVPPSAPPSVVPSPPPPPPVNDSDGGDDSMGGIIGGAVGVVVVVLLAAGGLYAYQKKKKKKTKDSRQSTADQGQLPSSGSSAADVGGVTLTMGSARGASSTSSTSSTSDIANKKQPQPVITPVPVVPEPAAGAPSLTQAASTPSQPAAPHAMPTGPTLPSDIKHHAFLTHDWGVDSEGRDNHARVVRVGRALERHGLRVWLDEEQMRGDINKKMADGIEGSACMVCFITRRYIEKASGDGPAGANDNCKFEFDHGLRRKGVERTVAVVMEANCRNPRDWKGVVGGKLGGLLYLDLSSDDESDFDSNVARLAAEIAKIAGA